MTLNSTITVTVADPIKQTTAEHKLLALILSSEDFSLDAKDTTALIECAEKAKDFAVRIAKYSPIQANKDFDQARQLAKEDPTEKNLETLVRMTSKEKLQKSYRTARQPIIEHMSKFANTEGIPLVKKLVSEAYSVIEEHFKMHIESEKAYAENYGLIYLYETPVQIKAHPGNFMGASTQQRFHVSVVTQAL